MISYNGNTISLTNEYLQMGQKKKRLAICFAMFLTSNNVLAFDAYGLHSGMSIEQVKQSTDLPTLIGPFNEWGGKLKVYGYESSSGIPIHQVAFCNNHLVRLNTEYKNGMGDFIKVTNAMTAKYGKPAVSTNVLGGTLSITFDWFHRNDEKISLYYGGFPKELSNGVSPSLTFTVWNNCMQAW